MLRINYFAKTFGGALATQAEAQIVPQSNGVNHKPSREISETTLDAIGREHEEIRARFDEISRKSNELIALHGDFAEVAEQVGVVLQNSEKINSELLEAGLKLARAEDAHDSLKSRHRALQDETEARRREILVLQADVERFGDLVDSREKRIEALETELTAASGKLQNSQQEVERLQNELKKSAEALHAAKSAIAANDLTIETLQKEASERNTKLSLAEFKVQATQRMLAEGHTEAMALRESIKAGEARAAHLVGELSQARLEFAGRRERIESLEAALAELRRDLASASQFRQQQADAHVAEIESLKANLAAASARADSAEQMLAEARVEIQQRVSEARKSERHSQELDAKLAPFDERVTALTLENAELNASVAELTTSRARLANRSMALVRAMKDQKAKLENSVQRVGLLEERMAADQAQFDIASEQLRRTVRDLVERLEKEKLAHQIASAALQSARGRSRRITERVSMHELLQRVDKIGANDRPEPASAPAMQPHSIENAFGGSGAGSGVSEPGDTQSRTRPMSPKTRSVGVKRESVAQVTTQQGRRVKN